MHKKKKTQKGRDIYVLDTNVLLYNPKAVYAFPGAEVVIPDQVLGELDRLKTARADKELRFRGREFARILFDLSEYGKLTEGIPFGDDSLLRVVTYDSNKTPDALSGKNTDDRILSIVYQLRREEPNRMVTIVTNDLNMLVKAQMLDLPVTRPGEEFAYGRFRRGIVWLNSQKRALSVTVVILALTAAIAFAPRILNTEKSNQVQTPPKLLAQLQQYQAREEGYKMILEKNPKDLQALIGLGNIYFEKGELFEESQYHEKAVEYYRKALDVDSKNDNVRLDMAIEYTKLQMNDIALRELNTILSNNANHETAHFYVGTILMDKQDLQGALRHFKKYQELAPNGPAAPRVSYYIEQIEQASKEQK